VFAKELYHPVLGKYLSEQPAEHPLPVLSKKHAGVDHVKLYGRDLMKALRNHHAQHYGTVNQDKISLFKKDSAEKLALGQCVLIKRKLSVTSAQSDLFYGVVIELEGGANNPNSFVRLRSSLLGVGVEMKIPVFSPLVEKIVILKKPKKEIQGPNLLGLRDNPDGLKEFMEPAWLSEKGRIMLHKQYRK
jgi:ribosomal protein L19